jgi:hypothetical protein
VGQFATQCHGTLTNFNRCLLDIRAFSINRDSSARKYFEFSDRRSTLDGTTPFGVLARLLGLALHVAARLIRRTEQC